MNHEHGEWCTYFEDNIQPAVTAALDPKGRLRLIMLTASGERNSSCRMEHFCRAIRAIANGETKYDKCAAVEIYETEDCDIIICERGNGSNFIELSSPQAMSIQAWARAVFTLKHPEYLQKRKVPLMPADKAVGLFGRVQQGFPPKHAERSES